MSIFGSTFKPFVIRQLETRQALLADGTGRPKRSQNVQLYTAGKTAWVKMQSFVDYAEKEGEAPSDKLARKYVLSAGTLIPDPTDPNKFSMRNGVANANGAYGSNLGNRQLGLRPMPGITSVNVVNKGAYGSLRLTTIKFKAWDKAQLDDLEVLYMRTGYPVLIEWGWSMYMDTTDKNDTGTSNQGHLNLSATDINALIDKPIKAFTDPTISAFDTAQDQEALYDRIMKLNQAFSGNYDGMVGIIQNFTWELTTDGSYDCTTILVSMGDTLDSIKMNRPSQVNGGSNPTGYKTSFTQLMFDLLNGRISPVISKRPLDVSQAQVINPGYKPAQQPTAETQAAESQIIGRLAKYNGDLKNIDNRITVLEGYTPNPIINGNAQSTNPCYIQLAYLVAIIQEGFNLFTEKGTPLMNIELPIHDTTGVYSNRGNGLCLASVDSVSVDPSICLIKNSKASWITGLPEGFDVGKAIQNPDAIANEYLDESGLGVIGNIYMNMQYVSNTFNDILAASKDGEVHIYTFIRTLMEGVAKSLGNINDFDVFVEDNNAIIIDKHYTEPKDKTKADSKFQLNIFGNNTVVRGFKILSKIFQSQASMIAIAAGSNRVNLGGVNSSTQSYFNYGLSNRLTGKLSTDATTDSSEAAVQAEKVDMAKGLITMREYLAGILSPDAATRHFISNTESVQAASTMLNSVLLTINTDANYRSVIPLSVEITLDGLSGITIGEVFRLNTDMLPKEYTRKDLGFMVTGIQQNIVKSDWMTVISAYVILLNQSDAKKEASAISLSKSKKDELGGVIDDVKGKDLRNQQRYVKTYIDFLHLIRHYYSNNLKFAFEFANSKKTEADKLKKTYYAAKEDYTIIPKEVWVRVVADYQEDYRGLLAGISSILDIVMRYEVNNIKDYEYARHQMKPGYVYNDWLLNPLIRKNDVASIHSMLVDFLTSSADFTSLQTNAPELAKDLLKVVDNVYDDIKVQVSGVRLSNRTVLPLMYDTSSPFGNPRFTNRDANNPIKIPYKHVIK